MHTATDPITEPELRAFVRAQLDAQVKELGGRVFEELGLERGAARVDLALVSDLIEAFELKSDLDNFGRLHNQIHAYNRVFDRITMVTGAALSAAAMEVMPSWWGIWAVRREPSGELALERLREPMAHTHQELRSLAEFLWRDEAMSLLLDEGGAPSKRANRAELCEQIAARVELATLRRRVASRLIERQDAAAAAKLATSAVSAPDPSGQDGGWSHRDASYLDSHFLV